MNRRSFIAVCAAASVGAIAAAHAQAINALRSQGTLQSHGLPEQYAWVVRYKYHEDPTVQARLKEVSEAYAHEMILKWAHERGLFVTFGPDGKTAEASEGRFSRMHLHPDVGEDILSMDGYVAWKWTR